MGKDGFLVLMDWLWGIEKLIEEYNIVYLYKITENELK